MKTKRIISASAVAIMGALMFSTVEFPTDAEISLDNIKPSLVAGASRHVQSTDLKQLTTRAILSGAQKYQTATPNKEPVAYKGPTEAIENKEKVIAREAKIKLDQLAAEQILPPAEQPVEETKEEPIEQIEEQDETRDYEPITISDISERDLLYRCVQAEAYTMGYEGMRVITDAILNLAREHGASITDTILAPGQFEVVTTGAIWQNEIFPETKAAVDKELEGTQVDDQVMYFRTKHYHDFGTPLYNIDNVYFSTK